MTRLLCVVVLCVSTGAAMSVGSRRSTPNGPHDDDFSPRLAGGKISQTPHIETPDTHQIRRREEYDNIKGFGFPSYSSCQVCAEKSVYLVACLPTSSARFRDTLPDMGMSETYISC